MAKRKSVEPALEERECFDVEVLLASGELLRRGATGPTALDVALQLPVAGGCLQQLVYDQTNLKGNQQMAQLLPEVHDGPHSLLAVVGAHPKSPTLHLFDPCTSRQLAERRGGWIIGGIGPATDECLCHSRVQHNDMASAPFIARSIAEALLEAGGAWEDQMVLDRGYSLRPGAEVVVITQPGSSFGTRLEDGQQLCKGGPAEVCIQALALRDTLPGWEDHDEYQHEHIFPHALVEQLDFRERLSTGLGRSEGQASLELRRCTELMAKHLKDHFSFRYAEAVSVTPMLFGGVCADGSIVAVLCTRLQC